MLRKNAESKATISSLTRKNYQARFFKLKNISITPAVPRSLSDRKLILMEYIPILMARRGDLESAKLCLQFIRNLFTPQGAAIDRLHQKFNCKKDIKSIVKGEFDNEIKYILSLCYEFNDIESVRKLTFVLFSGDRIYPGFGAVNQSYSTLQKDLRNPDISIGELIQHVLIFYQDWKDKYEHFEREYGDQVYELRSDRNKKCRYDYTGRYLESHPKSPENKVAISHGGGLYHILSFLFGQSVGYDIDGNGIGIFVSPKMSGRHHFLERDSFYAPRSLAHFDRPARLVGKISEEYLLPANNSYEKGLERRNLEYLEYIEISVLTCF